MKKELIKQCVNHNESEDDHNWIPIFQDHIITKEQAKYTNLAKKHKININLNVSKHQKGEKSFER